MAQTLNKAIKVIETIADNQPVEVKRLSRLLGIPVQTLYRFISALEKHGYVVKAAEDGKYQLGISFLRLGASALAPFRLRDFVHPVLKEIAAQTRESASFQIRRGLEAICIDCVESDNTVRFSMRVGQVRPLYAGAGPKILLAYLDEEKRESLISALTLKKIGPNTIASKEELGKRLAAIVKRGYEVTEEEVTEGARSIAVPVFDKSGEIIAALTANGLKYRMREKQLLRALKILKSSAEKLSDKLALGLIAAR